MKRFILAEGYPFQNIDNPYIKEDHVVYMTNKPWEENRIPITWHTGIKPATKYALILEEIEPEEICGVSPKTYYHCEHDIDNCGKCIIELKKKIIFLSYFTDKQHKAIQDAMSNIGIPHSKYAAPIAHAYSLLEDIFTEFKTIKDK